MHTYEKRIFSNCNSIASTVQFLEYRNSMCALVNKRYVLCTPFATVEFWQFNSVYIYINLCLYAIVQHHPNTSQMHFPHRPNVSEVF